MQIPLAMLMDVLIRGKTYTLMFYLGSIPVALSIVFVAVLLKFEDSDPVLMLFKMCYRKVFRISCRPQVLRVNSYEDDEQQESLINGEDDNEGSVVVHWLVYCKFCCSAFVLFFKGQLGKVKYYIVTQIN